MNLYLYCRVNSGLQYRVNANYFVSRSLRICTKTMGMASDLNSCSDKSWCKNCPGRKPSKKQQTPKTRPGQSKPWSWVKVHAPNAVPVSSGSAFKPLRCPNELCVWWLFKQIEESPVGTRALVNAHILPTKPPFDPSFITMEDLSAVDVL